MSQFDKYQRGREGGIGGRFCLRNCLYNLNFKHPFSYAKVSEIQVSLLLGSDIEILIQEYVVEYLLLVLSIF